MQIAAILVSVPLIAGLLCLSSNSSRVHRPIIIGMAAIIGFASLAIARLHISTGSAIFLNLPAAIQNNALLVIDAALAVMIVGIPLRSRRWDIALLAVGSAVLSFAHSFEKSAPAPVVPFAIIDGLAVIMIFIIAIIGGLIAIHAISYMEDYTCHHAADHTDRRRYFFFIIGLFLSAMLGLVLVNHLGWLFAFWEITTLCSFLLIGYSQTEEATNNAFRALRYNIIGGVAFAAALFYMESHHVPPALTSLVPMIGNSAAQISNDWKILVPISLLAIAALTKSAQMPFSSWLLGAMVAPSTVSALLHSSTMVKAGVYLLIRLAPPLAHTKVGLVLSLIGAVTFMVASFLAIPQRNAKLVLAYSTIANLGLIVTCAGTGDQRAIWAAILLLIFHAVAKALLFLAVGTLEHKTASRDIETMQGLIVRNPGLAVVMLIGMAGMFLAPFGMLVSKWAAIEALVQVNLLLPLLIAFGSGATLFFWCKWMGRLIGQPPPDKLTITPPHSEERISLIALATLTIILCGGFPLLSAAFIEPDLQRIFGLPLAIGPAVLWIMPMMLVTIALLPTMLLVRNSKQAREVEPYMSGANAINRDNFIGSMGRTPNLTLKNYYLADVFPERKLLRAGVWSCAALVAALLVLVRS
jgi:ech hydrogenase subunit A